MAAKKTTQGKEFEKALKASVEAKVGGNFDSIDIYSGKYSRDELQIIRKTLAKRANQRLVRLERSKSSVTGEQFSSYGAAEKAYDYIEKHRPGGKQLRYSENFGFEADSTWDIKKEITAIQTFLGSKSSTVKGQKQIEQKRIKTFESGNWGKGKDGIPIKFASNKEFYDFLSSNTLTNLVSSGLVSEDIVDVYVRARDKGDSADAVMQRMSDALEAYRGNQAKVSVKDLEKRVLKGVKNEGGNN